MEPLKRFLLSNSNMAGCVGASAVVLLFLVGLISHYWFALSLLAYALGYLVFQRPAPAQLPVGSSTEASLCWLQDQALPKLPPEAASILQHMLTTAKELMPKLKELETSGTVQVENRAMLKQTMTRYLPDALESYMRLPPLYAKSARLANGKTPVAVLVEQLLLLDAHLTELRESVLSTEVDALLANGRFLQEKFTKALTLT